MGLESSEEKMNPLNLEEADTYVGKALRRARPEDNRACCIDGRYPLGSGAISMAGGDAGLLAIGLAFAKQMRTQGINVPREAIRDAVFKAIGGVDKFHFHTDIHYGPNGSEGCGHCRLLKMHPEKYFLDETDAGFMQKTLDQLEKGIFEGNIITPDILLGNHEERAVFVTRRVKNLETEELLSPEEAEDPANMWVLEHQALLKGGDNRETQAFVYRSGMVEHRLRKFAEALIEEIDPSSIATTEDVLKELKKIERAHLDHTREELAGHLPVYEVVIEASTGRHKTRLLKNQ